jgi:hypothetical protein
MSDFEVRAEYEAWQDPWMILQVLPSVPWPSLDPDTAGEGPRLYPPPCPSLDRLTLMGRWLHVAAEHMHGCADAPVGSIPPDLREHYRRLGDAASDVADLVDVCLAVVKFRDEQECLA